MLRIPTALLLLSPAIASAQCLTAESLDAGITVEYGNGNISYIQRQPDGTILDAYNENDSYYPEIILFESHDGVVESRWTAHEKDTWAPRSITSKTYDFAADSLAPYTAGMRGTGTTTWADNRYYSGDKTYSWFGYESEPLVIGDCSYDAVRVFTYELSIPDEDFYIREIKYLPALGIGLQIGNSYFGFSPQSAEIINMSAS